MISIIVPVYQSEKTLERCIRSLLQQSYRELEIIMVVDGPPDATGILADRLALTDTRLKVIHQSNQGVSAARNTGIEAASGTYLQFVDSDDSLEPDACEQMLTAMEDTQADMVIAGFHHMYFGRDVVKLPNNQGVYELSSEENIFLDLYETQFLNMPWNKLYKTELVDTCFPLDMTLGEDLYFNLAYMRTVARVSILQKPVYRYVQDNRGTTLSTKKRSDRIMTSLYLYHTVQRFCKDLYGDGNKDTRRESILRSKVAVEFLDACEGIYVECFHQSMCKRAALGVIREYRQAFGTIQKKGTSQPAIVLHLLDYKILYYFFWHNKFKLTYWLILLRGVIVEIKRRIGGNYETSH
ncbi:MAG: glycosyltransferase family 2 protein [Lachnospiraceae bacterium]